MLASPLLPSLNFSSQHAPDDYRPAKDLDAFNKLLPPPVEFVEGSSSGAYAVPEGKYKPINVAPPPSPKTPARPTKSAQPISTTTPAPPLPSSAKSLAGQPQTKSLWSLGIDTSWPPALTVGSGLHNLGNTCFLNSALQCLIHTPPLLHILTAHSKDSCRNDKTFCMACALRTVASQAHNSRAAFSPTPITNRLQTIAKHMRKGRQEDTHEFLRYAIDALQKACLFGQSPKIDPRLAETTWVHKIFGGRLRSRVTCHDCGHNSDTFDRALDLSLDIFKAETLRDALKKFVAVDYLKGADKYKCEKCKKPVVAEKRFTIHEAPVVLTVHLKRFSPLGRKIAHHVDYDEKLALQPYMSEGQYGPSYSLYGVICHAGGGPNSGHYYAFVKSREGKWYEMNDESVQFVNSPPTNKKSAYMLFYLRDKGQSLEAVIKSKANGMREQPVRSRISDGMKGMKRKERDVDMEEGEDKGEKVEKPFIGPLMPSPSINGDLKKPRDVDPQAASIQAKIQSAQKARTAMTGLSQYNSEGEDEQEKEEKGDKENEKEESLSKDVDMQPSTPPNPPPSSSPVAEPIAGIPPTSFYGQSRPPKRRKSQENQPDRGQQKRPIHSSSNKVDYINPYNSVVTYSSKNKKRRPPRGI